MRQETIDFFNRPIKIEEREIIALEWTRIHILGPVERRQELERRCEIAFFRQEAQQP